MTDRTRLILTGLTLGVGLAMTACGGAAPFEPQIVDIADRETLPEQADDGSDGRGQESPEGLEIR